MIEKLVTSKTRLKILKLFLSNMDDRYYLRELERMLDESLSPLRRQLVRLTQLGILTIEDEANLKYYRLNKNFEGLEDLKTLILGKEEVILAPSAPKLTKPSWTEVSTWKRSRFDLAALSFISIFVLITALFVVYSNTKNMKQVAKMIAKEQTSETAVRLVPKSDTVNGEMTSRKWKVVPGNIPELSSGETGEKKNSKEL